MDVVEVDVGRVALSAAAQRTEAAERDMVKPKWIRYLPNLNLAKSLKETGRKSPPKSVRFQVESKKGVKKSEVIKATSRSVSTSKLMPRRIRTSQFAASTLKTTLSTQTRSGKSYLSNRSANIEEASLLFEMAKI